MNLTEAINVVRENYPNNLIISAFETTEAFYFTVSSGKIYYENDYSNFTVQVDKKNAECSLFDYVREVYTNPDSEIVKASADVTFIDIQL